MPSLFHSNPCSADLAGIVFKMLTDHEALRVEVNYGDHSAPAGQFGFKAHVAQADLKAIAFGLYVGKREAREVQELHAHETKDSVFQREGSFRFVMHSAEFRVEPAPRRERNFQIEERVVGFN